MLYPLSYEGTRAGDVENVAETSPPTLTEFSDSLGGGMVAGLAIQTKAFARSCLCFAELGGGLWCACRGRQIGVVRSRMAAVRRVLDTRFGPHQEKSLPVSIFAVARST